MADDDEEGAFGGLYENGHWVWDDVIGALSFISDLPPAPVETVKVISKVPSGAIVFRDDVDLIEQFRYRRRYQRKLQPGQPDIITLQDIKDIAIYTAPIHILSPMLINMLHLPTTERFLRALILCSGYYLQVSDQMACRVLDLESKVRTPDCEILEHELRENLSDLRVLVAKEYCVMLIELEISRLFKSEIFNSVEHTLKTGYITKMTPEERAVLLGRCVKYDKKLNSRSPFINEVFCHREIDYRLMGLGVVKYPQMSSRQMYFWYAIAGKEEYLVDANVSLGIIGMSRSKFDTMLNPLPEGGDAKSKASVSSRSGQPASIGTKSAVQKVDLCPEIVLPAKSTREADLPPHFPEEVEPVYPVNNTQRRRWQNRLTKLLGGTVR